MASTMQMHGVGGPFVPLATLLVNATEAVLDGLRTLTINPIVALGNLQARAEQRRRLAEMDDRLLADIGLDRATALEESRKSAWTA